MADGYTRQSEGLIVAQATIRAAHFNAEFDAVQSFAHAATGHDHDGTAGGGAPISKLHVITEVTNDAGVTIENVLLKDGLVDGVDINNIQLFSVIRQTATATAGQTAFTLGTAYTTGINALMVYVNGSRMRNEDFTETSTTIVTFAQALTLNDEVLFEFGMVASGTTTTAAMTTFAPTGTIEATNVQAAITEVEADVAAYAAFKLDLAGGTMTGAIKNPAVEDVTIAHAANGTLTLDAALGSVFNVTATANITAITVTNLIAGADTSVKINAINWGAFTVTWAEADATVMHAAGNTAPTLTAAGTDKLELEVAADGTYTIIVRGLDVKAIA